MALIKSFVVLGILLIVSCSSENREQEEGNSYKEQIVNIFMEKRGLENYFLKEFDSAVPDTLFYIPISSCESCVHKTFKLLRENLYSNVIIIGGDTAQYIQYREDIAWHKNNSNLLFDSNYLANRYNLEIFGVTSIFHDQNSEIYYSNISWQNINQFAKHFNWVYSESEKGEH